MENYEHENYEHRTVDNHSRDQTVISYFMLAKVEYQEKKRLLNRTSINL